MAIDTSSIDIVALYERETGISLGKPVSRGEKACCKGSCFLCGGDNRFAAFFQAEAPHYHCGVNGGNGCGWHGDAIELVRKIHGFSFAEACLYLEIPLDGTEYRGNLAAKSKTPPQDIAPGVQWQRRAGELVKDAHDFLAREDETARRALNYLHKRGLRDETIKAARLGYLPESRYELRADWGLPDTVDPDGKTHTKLFIPRGWLIPWLTYPDIWRVDIRRHPRDIAEAERQGKQIGKYHKLAGSSEGLYNFLAIKEDEPLIIVESPIDALIGQQEAHRDFHWVATGGAGGARNDPKWKQQIALAFPVLMAFDSDQAGSNAYASWRGPDLPIYRWLPTAHDINDMLLTGQDINEWAGAGAELAIELDMQRERGKAV